MALFFAVVLLGGSDLTEEILLETVFLELSDVGKDCLTTFSLVFETELDISGNVQSIIVESLILDFLLVGASPPEDRFCFCPFP